MGVAWMGKNDRAANRVRTHKGRNGGTLKTGESRRIGRLQRCIRRAFIAADGRPLSTGELARRYYHRDDLEYWHFNNVARAMRSYKAGVRAGIRTEQGRATVWVAKAELLRRIRGE
jgi:hypothetical protein